MIPKLLILALCTVLPLILVKNAGVYGQFFKFCDKR